MTYYTYILQSEVSRGFYVGQTNNLGDRLQRHNAKRVNYTKRLVPWRLVWYKAFHTRAEAVRMERAFKQMKSAVKIREHIEQNPCDCREECPITHDLLDRKTSA